MSLIWTVTEEQVLHDSISLRLYYQYKSMNVYYYDVKTIPIPQSCSSLLMNSDFETGDSSFLEVSDRRSLHIDISTPGAGGSSYSLMAKIYTSRHSFYLKLDTRCIIENQEFFITAKFRLHNETNPVFGVECEPSIKNKNDANSCPSVAVYGSNCDGDNQRFYFFNEINQIQWNPTSFNDFKKAFPITANLASCKVSKIFNFFI